MAEGPGLFRSTDGGTSWQMLGRQFGSMFMADPRFPDLAFGGSFGPPFGTGKIFVSSDRGATFRRAGRTGSPTGALTVSGFALSADGRQLHVASYGGGIIRATIPAGAP